MAPENRDGAHVLVRVPAEVLREAAVDLLQLARTGPYIAGSQMAVVVGIEKASPLAVSDGSRAIQDMMLVAWSDGVGSNWVGYRNLPDEVSALLGVPSELEVLAIVPFGYPARRVGRGKKQRKPIGQVVSRERFGQS